MKKIFLSFFLISAFFVSNAQNAAPSANAKSQENSINAAIEFESKVVDYGIIEHNSDGQREFKFKSTGTDPLIIKSAKGSCGCTVPKWPRKPIAPGESEEIKVTFNSAGKSGKQSKTITLVTNAIPNTTVLTISANILTEQTKEKQTK